MHLSKAAAVLSFFGALAIGIAAGYLADGRTEVVDELREFHPIPAENLVGLWSGTWGYNRERCTIEIERVDGEKFYGTLKKEGAEIALAGTLDPDGRRVFFRETRVLNLGMYSGWSLGTNTGSFSPDGRTLTGTGTDERGQYGWDAWKQ
jgi:hypothetical protein